MSESSSCEYFNISLALGEHKPEIEYRVYQGEEGEEGLLVVQGTLNGNNYSNSLFEKVIIQIRKTLPKGLLLSRDVKMRLAMQFRRDIEGLKFATRNLD